MAEERESLLVQSKVRDAIKAKAGEAGVRTSDEFLDALNEMVHAAIEKAIGRAKENGRSTLRKQDV